MCSFCRAAGAQWAARLASAPTVRVVHSHSRRRMIMSFVLVSSVQVFVVLGLLQLVLPPSITGDVYIGGEPSTCYVQYFDEGCCPTDGRYTALLVTTRRADACRCVWLTTSPPWLVCQARRATVSSTAPPQLRHAPLLRAHRKVRVPCFVRCGSTRSHSQTPTCTLTTDTCAWAIFKW